MIDESPEGWVTARLGDIFECWGGMTPSTSNKAYWGGSVPWLSSKDVKSWRIGEGTESVTAKALAETRLRRCRPGSVVVVVRSGVLARTLPVALTTKEVVINQDLKALDSGSDALNEWLALYFRAHERDILEVNRKDGTTVQSVRVEELLDRDVPLPPMPEQRRIVAKVERLFAQVRAARERLAKAPSILKRFRQAVLAAACSGRLTEDWRGHQENWRHVSFGEVLQRGPQNGLYRPQSDYGAGTLIVRIDDFHDGVLKDWGRLKRVRVDRDERDTFAVHENDLLINRVNSPKFLGKPVLIPTLPEPAVFESNMMRCSLDRTRVEPEFVLLFLLSPRGREELQRNAKHAVNQASINQQDVRDISFPLPELSEQRQIVRRVRECLALSETTAKRIVATTAMADNLPRAILARAFSGGLVPTQAEVARAGGRDYEAASVLLERIRAGHAKSSPPRAAGRRKRGATQGCRAGRRAAQR